MHVVFISSRWLYGPPYLLVPSNLECFSYYLKGNAIVVHVVSMQELICWQGSVSPFGNDVVLHPWDFGEAVILEMFFAIRSEKDFGWSFLISNGGKNGRALRVQSLSIVVCSLLCSLLLRDKLPFEILIWSWGEFTLIIRPRWPSMVMVVNWSDRELLHLLKCIFPQWFVHTVESFCLISHDIYVDCPYINVVFRASMCFL